ncbi:hypothetical protein SPBR_04835 [Sporothrix brasiliensis 5110]|uniref:Uncharacterized protein n=1 Tax=Sporothrix brasiliensis 5110 TaxID=1398154 RepID=A0A0C2IFH1_9PEZI|nr:uncharacterized protein SPBR_04835 [Sporothrix brasiliensis 5110]KIH87971.1 hypothetical protein SPBR_04835 [Sporothrix brasiliensis 5110]
MKLLHKIILTTSCLAPSAFADFTTGSWPAPVDLSSKSSLVRKAFANITATLQEFILQDGNISSSAPQLIHGITDLTFSLGVFSRYDNAASEALQHHYTAPEIATAGNGTTSVDADSIYRVASVTKVLTTLSGLLKLSTSDWDRPISDIFPVLSSYEKQFPGGPFAINWTAVTPRNLGAQISGVPRDGFPSLNELEILGLLGDVDTAAMGLPPANSSDPLQNPPCVSYLLGNTGSAESAGGDSGVSLCPSEPYLESVANRPPVFSPWSSPGYANNGFSLLGLALENLVNTTYEKLVQSAIFGPLNMTSSNIDTPPKAMWNRCVIADASTPSNYFDINAGVFAASGAASSTLNDLARLGRSILDYTLLSEAETRRWLKPVSFTGRLQYAVGSPWEIHHYTLPNNKVVDLYTKSGDSGAYSAFFVLIPDYDIGFSLLSASSTLKTRFEILAAIADVVTYTLVPAIDAQAAVEASAKFAGTYSLGNSSLTLVVNQTWSHTPPRGGVLTGPGLVITNWTSNGTNVLHSELATFTGPLPYRLVPSIPEPSGSPTFRLLTPIDEPSAQLPISSMLFSGPGFIGADWIAVDALTYGGIGTTMFQFDIGSDGKACSVTLSSFRQTLPRTN